MRVYVVHHVHGKTNKLVRAVTASQALRHVAREQYSVAVASQDDLIKLVGEGVKVEDATGAE